ncbi:MgtC/SapB family protein [Treponema pectinovorum]|uniref:MgtC/SapB family protein n=1 Tax=Treponema pectinovorum TaxID=164 RepID=UPI0011F1E1AE|nr:MgtC/SapB family protein [Treponema pectinovorum]
MRDFYISCLIKIFFAFIVGFVLGVERKFRQQAVGMRTLILICESTTLLSILSDWISIQMGSADTARIAAGVISGIGFLGAGVIMKTGLNIKGLTSAAIIWTDATIGLCIGEGLYLPSFAVLVVSIISLISLEKIEERWFPARRTKSLHLTFKTDSLDMTSLKKLIQDKGFLVTDVNMNQIKEQNLTVVHYSVKAPEMSDYTDFLCALNGVAELSEFKITD